MKNIFARMGVAVLVSAMAFALNACGSDSGSSAGDEPGASSGSSESGSMTDSRDGQKYKTVKIGKMVWMAENMNYKTAASKCYDDKPENCEKYGRLYNWDDAMAACPNGWHLPSQQEFEDLFEAAEKAGDDAGIVLKSTSGWIDEGEGTDALKFGAEPSGWYDPEEDAFLEEGVVARLWSSEEENATDSYYAHFDYAYDNVEMYMHSKGSLHSVRCVKEL